MIIFWCAMWYVSGVVLFVKICYDISYDVYVKDIIVGLLVGIFGPVLLLILWLMHSNNSFLNKRIF